MDNSVGTFLPADPVNYSLTARAYDLRHMIFGLSEDFVKASTNSDAQASPSGHVHSQQSGRSIAASSGRRFEAVASYRLIWWNQGSNLRKKLSIWRPDVPQGMVYFGDIAVKGCVILVIFIFIDVYIFIESILTMDCYMDLGMSLQILALFFMTLEKRSFSKPLWVSSMLGKSRNKREWRQYLSGYLNLPQVLFL